MGEPTRPPPLAPARDPPAWAGDIDAGEVMDRKGEPAGSDPLAQPEPESIFDPRIKGSKYTPWRCRDRLAKRRRCARFGDPKTRPDDANRPRLALTGELQRSGQAP